jgi:hypothetical protein
MEVEETAGAAGAVVVDQTEMNLVDNRFEGGYH